MEIMLNDSVNKDILRQALNRFQGLYIFCCESEALADRQVVVLTQFAYYPKKGKA
jgi:hypothetical protein